MAQKYANAARAELAATINDTDLALEIVTGGELFPVADTGSSAISAAADWFKLTLQDDAGYEIVFVRTHTSGSVNFTNILRGQEGTTAREFLAGSVVGLRPTAGDAESYATSDDLTATATTKLPLTGGTMTGAITFAGAQTWPAFNQNTTGNAATATNLATARTINGVSFDGTANISVQVDWTGGISGKPAVIAAGADVAAARAVIGALGDATSDGKTYGRKDAGWAEVVAGGGSLTRSARTSNTALTAADKGKLIDITSGTFTQTFDAAATLGDGWWCYVRNEGTGDITLDPNSTETIDGLASFVLYPGAVRLVLCDGTALYSIPIVGGTKTFTTTGSYVWAPGIQQWDADLIAGGGGGGGGSRQATRMDGAGGGAGERLKRKILASEVVVGATTTCTVGAKGTGGAAAAADNSNGGNGTDGGNSSVGALAAAIGGGGGEYGGVAAWKGGAGGGKGTPYTSSPTAQIYITGQSRQQKVPQAASSGVAHLTEWGGPAGRPGDSAEGAVTAALGGQKGGFGGGLVAAGVAGANGTGAGDAGNGGGGRVNGAAAGKGGDGADGKITIVEVI